MLIADVLGRVVRAAVRRPVAVVVAVGVVAVVGAGLALRLDPSTGIETLAGRSSEAAEATERFHSRFGDDAVVVLVKGDIERTVLSPDLGRLFVLEGCLSGKPQRPMVDGRTASVLTELQSRPAVCRELARTRPAKVVYGPGTFVNTAAEQISAGFASRSARARQEGERAAAAAVRAARKQGLSRREQRRLANTARGLAQAKFTQQTLALGLRYGLTGIPTLDSPQFVSQLLFTRRQGRQLPKARFASLLPSQDAALIQVRLRPELSEDERSAAIERIRRAVREPSMAPRRGGRYVVSGAPVVVDAMADEVRSAVYVLLLAGLLVMAATLALVFRSRPRLLPLGLALAAAALTFGALSVAGGSLTMASIAALPVLIGLAVDYAIQLQVRFDEARVPRAGGSVRSPRDAAEVAATGGGPTVVTAGLATAAGFLVLLLSPAPMVRGFGLILVAGVVVGLACALTAGFAALVRHREGPQRPPGVPPALPRARALGRRARDRGAAAGRRAGGLARKAAAARPVAAARGLPARAWRRVATWLALEGPGRGGVRAGARTRADAAGTALRRGADRALAYAVAQPRRVLLAALVIAVAGWAADTQTRVVSDVRELVPQDFGALRDLDTLQRASGVSGEIDVLVEAEDLADPAVLTWMVRFQRDVLRAHGYREGASCRPGPNAPELCPALSLPDLFRTGQVPDRRTVEGLLAAVPPYFSQAVITEDRRTANLAFGIRLMPLERQHEVIEDIKRRLDPPTGVSAQVAGLPVLAAEANAALSSTWRRLATFAAGLLAVFLVLLAVRRHARAAAIPLIPIALAGGWSALVLFVLRIPLNPMSASLAVLVIAITTEFAVLLSARYAEERAAGATPRRALDNTYRSTGAAVLASGATAIAGFLAVALGALVASDFRMLRDFGAVTVVDLAVSLAGVMFVLPAALVWAEEHGPFSLRRLDPREWAPEAGRSARAATRRLRTRRRAAAGGRVRAFAARRPRAPSLGRLRAPWRRGRA